MTQNKNDETNTHTSQIFNEFLKSFKLKCPECHVGELFESKMKIKLNKSCKECGKSFENFDTGDGPVYVVGFLVCFLVPVIVLTLNAIVEINSLPLFLIGCVLTFILSYLGLLYSRSNFMAIENKVKKLNNGKIGEQ